MLCRAAARAGQVAVPQYDLPASMPALPKFVPGPVPPVKQVQSSATDKPTCCHLLGDWRSTISKATETLLSDDGRVLH